MSKQKANTDKEAVEYFKNYLQQEGFSGIEKLPTFSDVAADVKAVSPKGRVTYFEIKSTKQNDSCWSRISFNELASALDSQKYDYDYFFVIIRKGNTSSKAVDGFRFIYPKDKNGLGEIFLSIEDILKFTTRHQFYFGIDINVNYKNSLFSAERKGVEEPYSRDDVKTICDKIKELKEHHIL